MNTQHTRERPAPDGGDGLAGLDTAAPPDFALRVLRRVGIPEDRYDSYAVEDGPAGAVLVAFGRTAVTGAAVRVPGLSQEAFESGYRARTGRSVLETARSFPGVRGALRTGRARRLPIDLGGLDPEDRAVLEAVRAIPAGQLRPLSWLAREAGLGPAAAPGLVAALARNPVQVLVPCHRVTHENGMPCDASLRPAVGDALRTAEGLDTRHFERVTRSGTVFLGSDTTHIYCHPTCAHARRITPRHQVPFRTPAEARRAGYRACKSCRPVTA